MQDFQQRMACCPDDLPTFPGGVNTVYTNIDEGAPTQEGMTLLDYFAARAMLVIHIGYGSPAAWAEACYGLAEAMLRARKARHDHTLVGAGDEADNSNH